MAISRSDMERQLRKMGGRIGFQEGGIMPRLNQLSGSVSSAEQMLQQINQRLQSAESSLGSGGGASGFANIESAMQPNMNRVPQGTLSLNAMSRPENNAGPLMAIPASGMQLPVSRGGPGPDQLQQAIGLADGGIASLQEPRQGYFLGKLVKKAKRAVKKVVKSPLGKAAILAAPFLLSGGAAGGLGSMFGKAKGLGSLISGLGSKISGMSTLGKLGLIGGASGLAGLMTARGQQEEDDEEDFYRGEGLDIADIVKRAKMNDPQFRFLPGAEFTGAYAEGGEVNLEKDPEYKGWKKIYMMSPDAAESHPKHTEFENYLKSKENKKAEGGSPVDDDDLEKVVRDFNKQAEMTGNPLMTLEELKKILGKDIKKARKYKVGKAEGGIMNLGGMEMDLRGGGFVPLGAKEKADDVPARLSKNEFVMTADAVRAAGGGSVDKGADKMYKLMKGLEAQV